MTEMKNDKTPTTGDAQTCIPKNFDGTSDRKHLYISSRSEVLDSRPSVGDPIADGRGCECEHASAYYLFVSCHR